MNPSPEVLRTAVGVENVGSTLLKDVGGPFVNDPPTVFSNIHGRRSRE